MALKKLGESKGYTLIGTDNNGVNAFFVKSDIIKDMIIPLTVHIVITRIPKLSNASTSCLNFANVIIVV